VSVNMLVLRRLYLSILSMAGGRGTGNIMTNIPGGMPMFGGRGTGNGGMPMVGDGGAGNTMTGGLNPAMLFRHWNHK
jgi:hypothetical protein